MKIWKSSLLIIGLSVLVLSSMTATAETVTDPTGDVHKVVATSYTPADKPNLDITEITYNDDGGTFTLTMTVDGTIEDSDFIMYNVEYDADPISYQFVYQKDLESGIGTNGMDVDTSPTFSISGDTITVVFTSCGSGDPADVTFHGSAYYKDYIEDTGESWWDYAPESFAPWYGSGNGDDGTGDDDDDDSSDQQNPPTGTPGFEAIAVIGAIAVALILLRKRK